MKKSLTMASPFYLISAALAGVAALLSVTSCSIPNASAADVRGVSRPTQGLFGAGVFLGEPTGFSGKYWLSPDQAIDAGLAFSFSSFFIGYGDYLYHFPGLLGKQNEFFERTTPYIGAGAALFLNTDTRRRDRKFFTNDGDFGGGVRVVFGAEWMAPKLPIGVYVDLVPGVGLFPSTFGFFQGGIGARWYFQ